MTNKLVWIVDFDETLATGNLTWALEHAFPKFIAEHGLAYDPKRLGAVMLRLQEASSTQPDPEPLMAQLFEAMGWDQSLQQQLLHDIFSNYQPVMFDDARIFLERLRERGDRVFVVSNNPRTPAQMSLLGLDEYVEGVYTPHLCPGTRPKPDRSLWEYLIAQDATIEGRNTVVVGDDPWSEGMFADACALRCWIVDRMDRFSGLSEAPAYTLVRSLQDILDSLD